MLESECRFKRIRKPPYFNRWINLKVPFGEVFDGAWCNLKEAVELAGMTWEGRAHCGLDDANNTARLMAHLMARGFKFSITNTLLWQSVGHPHDVQHQVSSPPDGFFVHPSTTLKWKSPPYYCGFPSQLAQPAIASPMKEPLTYCHCGAVSTLNRFNKSGPEKGSFFFGCGNGITNRGPVCNFFKWVTADQPTEAG